MSSSDSRLVLRDIPIFLWIFGLIFAGVGAFMWYEGVKASIMALAFLAIGLSAILFTSVLTITADKVTRTLTLEYRSVMLGSVKQVLFDDIAAINVERSVSHGKGGRTITFRVTIVRKDGGAIPLRSYSSSGSGKKRRIANDLREFIGVQGFDGVPSGPLHAALLLRAAEIRETDGVKWQVQPMTGSSETGVRWHSADFKSPGVFLFIAQKADGQATGGFLASLGSMFFRQIISIYGFQADDTPGLHQASGMAPLDPALEPHFMAYTNAPDAARQLLNSRTVASLAEWAGRYPIKQFHENARVGQLAVLYGPNGVYLVTYKMAQIEQVDELAALGAPLVRAQGGGKR